MKQVFYIERDDEITSLVDKLRRSKATENVFVLPERAIVLQSIVSLKLLRNESEKLGKRISVLTTDQQERSRVEKAGINLESPNEVNEKEEIKIPAKEISPSANLNNLKNFNEEKQPKKVDNLERLDNLGTNSFFGNEKINNQPKITNEANNLDFNFSKQEAKNEYLKGKENVFKNVDNVRKEKLFSEITKEKIAPKPAEIVGAYSEMKNKDNNFQYTKSFDPRKEEIVKDFFNPQPVAPKENPVKNYRDDAKKENNYQKNIHVSSGLKKFFIIFSIFCLVAIVSVLAFVMLPKAKIAVTLKDNYIEKDFQVKGDKNVTQADSALMVIPMRVSEMEDEIDYQADATGNKSSDNKKARGKVVIYNEYNSESQQLVATTRLSTDDGKIFRITKGVTVPGISSIGGNNKPGAVEVEVVADQAGAEFNIDPTNFKIPGFEGSQKYDKFYAKSTESFTGGGTDENSGIKIVSQKDLDQAKKNAEEKIKAELVSKVKKELKSGEILLEEASEVTILESKTTAKLNDASQKFSYRVKASVKSLIFLESDVANMFLASIGNNELSINDVNISLGLASPDFVSSSMDIKAHGKIDDKNKIDVTALKKELLGKNEEEIKEVLANYPAIIGIDLELWPQFLSSRIPKNPNRVELKID